MSEKEEVFYLDVDEIEPDPDQPRKTFEEEDVTDTAFTILTQGQINPIEVNGGNRIVTGEIRWRAIKKAVENNPDMPELRKVKCIYWTGEDTERFERQVVENLHHHALTEQDQEAAIIKLWKSGNYPTMDALGKSVGLSRQRIGEILEAGEFRDKNPTLPGGVSTRAIRDTRGIEDETRTKILTAVAEEKVLAKDVFELKKIAQASEDLLDKALNKEVSVKRATEVAETVEKIQEKGVELSRDQKRNLAQKVSEDETLLKKYEDEVLHRVQKVMTTPKVEREAPSEPIGRQSPVRKMIDVKDEIQGNFRRYLGNCNSSERRWALRTLKEIKQEIDILIELISDD